MTSSEIAPPLVWAMSVSVVIVPPVAAAVIPKTPLPRALRSVSVLPVAFWAVKVPVVVSPRPVALPRISDGVLIAARSAAFSWRPVPVVPRNSAVLVLTGSIVTLVPPASEPPAVAMLAMSVRSTRFRVAETIPLPTLSDAPWIVMSRAVLPSSVRPLPAPLRLLVNTQSPVVCTDQRPFAATVWVTLPLPA